jgi:hypothetical protein
MSAKPGTDLSDLRLPKSVEKPTIIDLSQSDDDVEGTILTQPGISLASTTAIGKEFFPLLLYQF